MTTQTEAEQLADALQEEFPGYEVSDVAAYELRRLVSFNQQLMDEVARLRKTVAAERVRFALECIELVALYGGSVDLQAAIQARSKA